MYRVGFPGWKLAARVGVKLSIRVNVHFDPEVKGYWTSSPDLDGLFVTGDTLDELWKEAHIAVPELLEFALGVRPVPARAVPLFAMDAACAA